MTITQQDRAERFHALHRSGVLALANSWDVASALVAQAAGVAAIATTSAGVAWSLGAADGDHLDRQQAVDLIARTCRAVDLPVTADIESGFGATPADVAETVRAVIAAGAVGINIEDGAAPLRPVAEQAERIAAARAAAGDFPLFINARIDTFLRGNGDLADTVARAAAYLDAGASGIFVPGVADLETITWLVKEIDAPLNVLVGPGSPSIAELAAAGVARASLGSAVVEAAYTVMHRAATELLAAGTYESVAGALGYGELNGVLRKAATG